MSCFDKSIVKSATVLAGMIATWALVMGVGHQAHAQLEKLAPEVCRDLSDQLAEAERGGTRTVFDRGAAWAEANATPSQIAAVARYIALRERVTFRCPVGFDNLVVAAINGDGPQGPPPVPSRPSRDIIAKKRALSQRQPTRRITGVPLPVRKPVALRR